MYIKLNLTKYSSKLVCILLRGRIGGTLVSDTCVQKGFFQAPSTRCTFLDKHGPLFHGCCKNSKCQITASLQCFVEWISLPKKMFQDHKSKQENVTFLGFCVILLDSAALAV